MLHMIIEQTYNYPMRMQYHPESNSFSATEYKSLHYERGFTKPYGWIKESGTPPCPHWDCLLMTDKKYELGEEVAINIIGLFKRSYFDHKYVAVEISREIRDISELSEAETEELRRLYPRIREGEGWFGWEEAVCCMEHHEKAL